MFLDYLKVGPKHKPFELALKEMQCLEKEKRKYDSANLPYTPPGHNSRESGSELCPQCPLLVIKDCSMGELLRLRPEKPRSHVTAGVEHDKGS